jgi:hypothetical protein
MTCSHDFGAFVVCGNLILVDCLEKQMTILGLSPHV